MCLICSGILNAKQAETAELAEEYKQVDNEYNAKKGKLKDLMKKAEEIAPSEEWKARLAEDDIPSTREEVETEMDEAELKVFTTNDCIFCRMHE